MNKVDSSWYYFIRVGFNLKNQFCFSSSRVIVPLYPSLILCIKVIFLRYRSSIFLDQLRQPYRNLLRNKLLLHVLLSHHFHKTDSFSYLMLAMQLCWHRDATIRSYSYGAYYCQHNNNIISTSRTRVVICLLSKSNLS